jgi:hypothetical protein
MGYGMIAYENKEMVFDCLRDRIMVFDVNCQGILELDYIHCRLKVEFPAAVALVKAAALEGSIKPGDLITYEEGGYKIAFLATRHARVGSLKCGDDVVSYSTENLIKKCYTAFGEGSKFVSAILNRDISTSWPALHPIIKELPIDWVVYTK